jgi:hypothetical protein
VVRFAARRDAEGRRRYRTIYVGRESDTELANGTRNLLGYFRDRHARLAEIEMYARIAASWTAVLRRKVRAGGV